MSTKSVLFAFVATLGLAACGTIPINYSQLNAPPHPVAAKTPDKVTVLTLPPSEKYLEMGRITAHRDSFSTNDGMIAKMREEAALRGCDALVITQEGRPEANAADADGACIVYTGN